MGVERMVMLPFVRDQQLRHKFDYEVLEVGDYFIVKSNSVRKMLNRSIAGNRTARRMSFTFKEIEPFMWRVERVA